MYYASAATRYVHSHITKELKNPCNAGADDTLQHKMHKLTATVSDKEHCQWQRNKYPYQIHHEISHICGWEFDTPKCRASSMGVPSISWCIPEGSKFTPSPTLEVRESTVNLVHTGSLTSWFHTLISICHTSAFTKKFGTLLYRKGRDVLVSLSWALSNSNMQLQGESKRLFSAKMKGYCTLM